MKLFKSFLLAFAILFTSANIAFSQSASTPQQESTAKKTITVKGVTCAHDVETLSDTIKKLKGVTSCEVAKTGATSKFKVEFDPALVSEKTIHAAIEDTPGCENPKDRPYKVKL
ncbi:heavy metal-associated domain-containing protein [Flammeovirgaceae bacterium SG7u.111]|nr:heavy metal-associated domain-containing protein [Flammeovirgaceae bacterium SG7u.132]WPO36689.1 heavy metal-associated domain-containing protein [Flammeovirgaceae bacterium SG7u.111]